MQGHRSAIGSLPETLDFEHGSTSSSSAIEPQICWNGMRHPGEHRLSDYLPPPSHSAISYFNAVAHESQNLSRWSLGESSSSQNEAIESEPKTELGWSSSSNASAGMGSRAREWQYEQTPVSFQGTDIMNPISNPIASGPLFIHRSSTEITPQSINLNARFISHGNDDCQIIACHNPCKSNNSVNEWNGSTSRSSGPFAAPSGCGGFLVEESDRRPDGPLEARRLSCKRKAMEGDVGQSSSSGSSRCIQHSDNIGWHGVTSNGGSLNIYSPPNSCHEASHSDQLNSRLGLGPSGATESLPDLSVSGVMNNSHRNSRLRMSTPLQVSLPQNFVQESDFGLSGNLVPRQPSTLLPPPPSLPQGATSVEASGFHNQPIAVQVPTLQRNAQSIRWHRGSSSRSVSLSNLQAAAERGIAQHEETLRNARHILEHPVFVPATEVRNLSQNPTSRSVSGGTVRMPRNSTSTARSVSGISPSAAGSVPGRNPSRYPRRLSEYVRRSLLASAGTESGSTSNSSQPTGLASHEVALSSGTTNQGNLQAHPRSIWMERPGDGVFGVPYSVRTFASASEGRSRLVSEIRNVLDLMRRGEGLRFEDVMLLDQSGLFGVADIHDRHRDMRLDVDNMSYEELLALEERIGNVNTGLTEDIIMNRLKQHKYLSIRTGENPESEPCSVCQEEYTDGEDIGTVECGHQFHTGCIKQWLMLKNLCPICKTTGLSTT